MIKKKCNILSVLPISKEICIFALQIIKKQRILYD
jgi:hypothetical protein